MRVRDTWTRLEQSLQSIEGATDQLARGATSDMLLAAEEKLRIEFPRSFRESYQIHDGTEGHLFVVGPYRLWPLSFVVEENLRNKSDVGDSSETLDEEDDAGLIRGCIFSTGWTTFGDDGGASQLAIDFDPGEQGTAGQVIALYEDGTEHVASSFGSFLDGVASDIESGALEWNEGAGQYWPAGDREAVAKQLGAINPNEPHKKNAVGPGIAIGAGVGAAIGVAMDNIAVGVGVGVAIGAAIGASMQRKNR